MTRRRLLAYASGLASWAFLTAYEPLAAAPLTRGMRMLAWRNRRLLARAGIACVLVVILVSITGVPPVIPQPPFLWAAKATGYFQVERHNGIWWVIDPTGHPTLSIGVDNVIYGGDQIWGPGPSPYLEAVRKHYPDRAAWDQAARQRLSAWGFNTLGAWSDRQLWGHDVPYTVILDFAARAGADPSRGLPVDVFAPRFEATAWAIAEEEAAPRVGDPLLLGYFSDNELWWGSDWRGRYTMLAAYLAFLPGAPGRTQAIEFLRGRYGTIQRLNRAWHVNTADFSRVPRTARTAAYQADAAAFLGLVANRYFAVSAKVIHTIDPHHLYLGARFVGLPPAEVLGASSVADVVSINLYNRDPRAAVRRVYAVAGRPVLVSEFSFRALDSGLPNTVGAGPWVFDQRNRAMAYLRYVIRLESLPEAVGYHWFRWADEPAQGRAPDGENSNYGLVTVRDAPYGVFVDTISAVNRAAVAAHRGLKVDLPLEETVAWYTWNIHDVQAVLLGAFRWLSTAIRALRAFLDMQAVSRSPGPGT